MLLSNWIFCCNFGWFFLILKWGQIMKKIFFCPDLELFCCLPPLFSCLYLWTTVKLSRKKLQNATKVIYIIWYSHYFPKTHLTSTVPLTTIALYYSHLALPQGQFHHPQQSNTCLWHCFQCKHMFCWFWNSKIWQPDMIVHISCSFVGRLRYGARSTVVHLLKVNLIVYLDKDWAGTI